MSAPRTAGWYLPRAEPDGRPGRWRLHLTEREDPYLLDHLVMGEPTLPGTFLLEIAAEAAQRMVPGSVTTGFRDAEFTSFVRPPAARTHTEFSVQATVSSAPAGGQRVHVLLERILHPRGDATRARRRTCFATDVVVAPSGAAPAPRPVRPVPAAGAAAPDPYYRPGSPVRLRGVFHNTSDGTVTAGHRAARWTPSLAEAGWLQRFTIPCLLICSTLRTAALPADRHGEQTLYVPRHLGRIDLFTPGLGDTALAARHGDRVTLHSTTDGSFWAGAPDGTVLLEARDILLAPLGSV